MSQVSNNAPVVTYLELISQDEKVLARESLVLKAQESGLELNRRIFDISVAISKTKASITALQRQIPYNVAEEFIATKHLAVLEEELAFAKSVKETRFGDATI